jgi:hypothetical protein
MSKLKAFVIGTGVAGFNLLNSAISILRPERCGGSCGNCNYACVPTIFVLVGAGGLVVAYRRLKARFLKRRSEV